MAESIQQLRIYTGARQLEDRIYELVKELPEEQQYPLGNDLRRASAAVAHYIDEAHRRYSYRLKLESLAGAREAAELTQKLLTDAAKIGDPEATKRLIDGYIGVIKQAWALMRYLRNQRAERTSRNEARLKDEQVAARA
jgi:four helix bundle protein